MADISQINVGDSSYDIKDDNALHNGDDATLNTLNVTSTASNSINTAGRIQYSNSGDGAYGNIFASTSSDSIYLSHYTDDTMDIQWQFFTHSNGYGTLRYYDAATSSWKNPFWNALASRTANTVLAAPDGTNGTASFRKLNVADIEDLGFTRRTYSDGYTSIPTATSKYTSGALTGWNYFRTEGTWYCTGYIQTTAAISTAWGKKYQSALRWMRLPTLFSCIRCVIFGTSFPGSDGSGGVSAIMVSSTSTSGVTDWHPSTAGHTVASLPIKYISDTSVSSGTWYIPVFLVADFN